ncbi:RagB/SusD family nutrient uptake outer membrane protein [Prevotella sp. P6B4]|uniref:RagB/SusD family nutrient uptake outer membrane protein n=1 Tax=Prevotella sp. P6B4 TaxID=1410614 RepID=UPI0004903F90|nr:RagB/SusD family nutrient uptake outer membrane protein [Prevotella sp. P6B4]
MNKYRLYRFYIVILVFLGVLCGCNEDEFLKEEPRASLYPENLLVDYDGFKSMNISLYGIARAEYRRADALGGSIPLVLHSVWDGGTDVAWGNNSHSEVQYMYNPKLIDQTDKQVFRNVFQWCYRIINTANMVITRSENEGVNWKGSSEAENLRKKNEVIAEAKLFRAWAYRHLTLTYGGVPLSTEEITGLNYRTDWERNSVSEIRQVMEEDLKFAIEHLPLRTANNSTVSGAMARHYLGELYLAEGKYADAESVMKPLVEGTEYSLITTRFGNNAKNEGCPFIDVFRTPMYSDGNTEVILAFVNTEPENSASGTAEVYMKSTYKGYYANDGTIKKSNLKNPDYTSGQCTWPQAFWLANGGKGASRLAISRGLLRLYNYKEQGDKDDRISDHAMVWRIYEINESGNTVEFQNNGKAVIDTTVTAAMLDDTKTTIKKWNWPSIKKWDYIPPVKANGDKDGCYQDISYLRVADTYLLYAEALYKQGKNSDAVKWINKVRNRSNAVSITENDLVADGMDLILDERARELFSEEERRETLIRVSQEGGKDERDVNNYFKRRTRLLNEIAGRDARGMNDYETPVLFPIPHEFIESNTGRVLENNPGYKN